MTSHATRPETRAERAQRHLSDVLEQAIRDEQHRELSAVRRTLDKLKSEQDQRERLSPWRDRTRDGQLVSLIAKTEQRLLQAEACIDIERSLGLDPVPLPRDVDPSYRRGLPPSWKL
jgi:hypothetical protein